MNTLRRLGGNNKTKETKAAATGAKKALISVLFMFCLIIFNKVYVLFNFVQIIALNFIYARKNCYNFRAYVKHYNPEILA
ncbi:hypothetical protein [Mucilaginibacter sp. AK015]|uniref:hypothetical protein n=1 Tax=Mucilaginibacter sp. AK015 TaxID=2723072 RepID=UPI001613B257|nr:hypothetical protein [Mucilaginibacter sp. AK015]MBB5394351.1 hypothetical protein [Mucilaginibacter sp. AK015]